jgi:rhodanese-related sulfurtransferase
MQPSLPEIIAMAAKGEVTLVDVRELAELQTTGKAPEALHIPLGDLAGADLPGGKPIAVYCAAGGRAGKAVDYLTAQGHEAWNIGGLAHWAEAGGPVTPL